jgi:coproporphyrinogen III oxidase
LSHIEEVAQAFRSHQDAITSALEEFQGGEPFDDHAWTRDPLGGGSVRIMERGFTFERAGIATSTVGGTSFPRSGAPDRPELWERPYSAASLSMIFHAVNPYVPSFHANLRYFEVDGGEADWWFGGGMDLTPCYGFEQDARQFHMTLKNLCDRHGPDYYAAWKESCDTYFYLPHRGEMRGIGGIRFPRLGKGEVDWEEGMGLVDDAASTIIPAYRPIADRRRLTRYGPREKRWQQLRRGRYVEFNLVCDKGTQFGLHSGGNIEAILMSLPAAAAWSFDYMPPAGSPEANLSRFLQPRPWAERRAGFLARHLTNRA